MVYGDAVAVHVTSGRDGVAVYLGEITTDNSRPVFGTRQGHQDLFEPDCMGFSVGGAVSQGVKPRFPSVFAWQRQHGVRRIGAVVGKRFETYRVEWWPMIRGTEQSC